MDIKPFNPKEKNLDFLKPNKKASSIDSNMGGGKA